MTTNRPLDDQDATRSFKQVAADYISVSTLHLHNVPSRSDAGTLAAEVERLNNAVRASAGEGMSPYTQPADYQAVQHALADASNALAAPAGAAVGATGAAAAAAPSGKWLTLAEAARKLAAGETTSEELTRQALEQAETAQPH